jgi:hypothetical protein
MEATVGSLPLLVIPVWVDQRKLAQCEPNRAKTLRRPATPLADSQRVWIGVFLDGLEDPAVADNLGMTLAWHSQNVLTGFDLNSKG